MLGVGTRTGNIRIAVTAAIIFHIAALSLQFSFDAYAPESEISIQVQLQTPAPQEEPEMEEIVLPEPDPAVSPPAQEIDPSTLISSKPDPESEPAKVRLQTSPFSKSFNSFVQSETERHRQQNPQQLQNFSDTFEFAFQADESPTEITRDVLPRDSGAFMAEVNGKRLCGYKVDSLLEVTEAPMILTKDCTPQAKFELNLAAPNNGWMAR